MKILYFAMVATSLALGGLAVAKTVGLMNEATSFMQNMQTASR